MNLAIEMIRKATKILHSELDQMDALKVLLSEEVTINDYSKFLKILYCFYASIEPTCLQILNKAHPYHGLLRNRVSLLEEDLLILKEDLPKPFLIQIDLDSKAKLLGLIYAIEGSSHGGKLILEHLQKKLQAENLFTAVYLTNLSPMPHWKKIMDTISLEIKSDLEIKDAIYGASSVFLNLIKITKNI